MISRHITIQPENDDYRRLANYIADAGRQGEKVLMSWCAGCWSDDDEYQLAIHEVEAVQAMNTRSAKEKAYHLVISFRPEDEAMLTPEVFRAIELEFAKALGFEEHQRHAGVHRNTANLHLHIAFNEIHPVRITRHEPFRDFAVRDRLCRQLERRYGLTPDNGRDPEQKAAARNDKARAYEARTGQESLFGYVQRHKPDIMNELSTAKTWDDCHHVFGKYGLLIKPHGNGLVIQDVNSGNSIKASDLDRGLSKVKLEKRLGKFQAPVQSVDKAALPKYAYTAQPLQRDADRDDLYAEFLRAMSERRSELKALKEQEDRLYKELRQDWDKTWVNIKTMPMLRQHRQQVRKRFADKKKTELVAFRQEIKLKKDDVRNRYPFTAWNTFFQHKTCQGNETALAILRSRQRKIQAQVKGASTQAHDQNILTAVAQMREVLTGETTPHRDARFKYRVDSQGTIIFNLSDGVTIRDAGQEIYFPVNNEKAEALAAKLAKVRWGQSAVIDGHKLMKKLEAGYQTNQNQPRDMGGFGR